MSFVPGTVNNFSIAGMMADRARHLRGRGLLNAAPWIASDNPRVMTGALYPRLGYGSTGTMPPRTRSAALPITEYPDDGYRGQRRLLSWGYGQRHRTYSHAFNPGKSLYYLGSETDGVNIDDMEDITPFLDNQDGPGFRPIGLTDGIIIRKRMDNPPAGVGFTEQIAKISYNDDGRLLVVGYGNVEAARWNVESTSPEQSWPSVPLTTWNRQFEQLVREYRCTRYSAYRNCSFDPSTQTIALGTPWVALRLGKEIDAGSEYRKEFDPFRWYNVELSPKCEISFAPEFPEGAPQFVLKQLERYADIVEASGTSLSRAVLNAELNPLDDSEARNFYVRESNSRWPIETWNPTADDVFSVLFGTTTETSRFDVLIEHKIYYWKLATGEWMDVYLNGPDDPGHLVISTSDRGYLCTAGKVWYAV